MGNNTKETTNQNDNNTNILLHYEYILSRIYDQQTKVDTKASIFITFNLAILGFVINMASLPTFVKVLVAVGTLIALAFFIMILKPIHSKTKNKFNMYYYMDIAKLDAYTLNAANHLSINKSEEEFLKSITRQIFDNSKIVEKKNLKIRYGINTMIATVSLSVIVLILYKFISFLYVLLSILFHLVYL